jgi:hypothetical protein
MVRAALLLCFGLPSWRGWKKVGLPDLWSHKSLDFSFHRA